MSPAQGFSRVRWTICGLLFAATTINYLDRQLFPLLVPFFRDELKIGPVDLALINASFLLAYGFSMVLVGHWVDKVGVKKGFGWGFLVWNLAAAAHALVGGVPGFMGARFLLGIGESTNFPASIRTTTDWFPKKERALANGWFNAGSNIGLVLASILAVFVAKQIGWRAAFLALGLIGLGWLYFWRRFYFQPEDHPNISTQELEYIQSDPPEPLEKISYQELFGMRQVYAISMGKFFSDAPWWFYLTWLPTFLVDQYKLSPGFMSLAVLFVYMVADIGAIGGGWLSSRLIKAGKSVGFARKITMLLCACCALPVMTVGSLVGVHDVFGIPSVYVALGIVSIAAGAHQGWSCNIFTLVSDTLPKRAVAPTVGIITAFGAVGAAILQVIIGKWVQNTGTYTLPFILAGTLYFVGLGLLHVIMPKVETIPPGRKVSLRTVFAGAVGLLAIFGVTQYALNKPPYSSLDDYLAKRGSELKTAALPGRGPNAKVGWMDAKWFVWLDANQKPKAELIKFDRDARPIVDGKGAKTDKYVGPTLDQVLATTSTPKP